MAPVSVSSGEVKAGPVSAPVVPLILIGIGLYLSWFGVHYWRSDTKWPTDPVKSVLQGKGVPASDTPQPYASQATETPAQLGTGSVTGSPIADDAKQYVGQGYVWGGSADKPGDWDCSSFASYVLGHDLGIALPGGKWGDPGFPPNSHGPTTLQYLLYGTPISYGHEQPGDLLVSSEHMGICIGGGQMVSAQDPQLGTGIGGYQTGFPGGQPAVRRVAAPASVGGHT